MTVAALTRDAVLRVGEVCGVDGRRIYILVDKNKNLSDMFLDGDVLRNTSVNSFIEIRKGFLSIIGRVEGEKIEEEFYRPAGNDRDFINRNKRILSVALAGYIDERGSFIGGTKELPLIGNEAYIVTQTKIQIIHSLVRGDSPYVTIATSYGEGFDIQLPIDGIFNSHIAIFGNTGSGKSNTLAYLYQELLRTLNTRNAEAFSGNTRFVLFDFNGEYTSPSCITANKTVYSLSTHAEAADKLPLSEDSLLDIEILSVLAQASEKTQKPFIGRALKFLNHVRQADDPETYVKNILRNRVRDTLRMSDKVRAFLLLDYFREILPRVDNNGDPIDIDRDIDWHNTSSEFKLRGQQIYLAQQPDRIDDTFLYQHVDNFELSHAPLSNLICFLYLQLISDVLSNRAQNEHVVHVINRLKSRHGDIEKLFNLEQNAHFWSTNFVVVNLDDVNLEMKKTIPLLLAKKLYSEHKKAGPNKSLNIIVDEAHNILSTQSFREAETWKDYRLEVFEEIIKEGRKFGAFVTIASQRPNDISATLTSQAHNYFIHRLINQRDLDTIASAVSYIDRLTEESIPTLPTGTCIFSGVVAQMPIKINVKPLAPDRRPRSSTREFNVIVPELTVLPLD
jgi:uncharacterized protein